MIRAERLSFSIGEFRLQQLSLEVGRGKYFVLLGPPGSGKTVFLECLCGLRRPESGRIWLDGREVTALEPRARDIGYVPQDYALFPHLSVERNIAFGLRAGRDGAADTAGKVARTAEMLGIGHLLGRGISGLSGGEKQRTALARALVMEPKVLLLDEPVCALDESTRQSICGMLRRVQRRLELSVVHVSHNLEEAFSVADEAAILNEGVLQQAGTLDELLRRPRNEFVARFMRCENIFSNEIGLELGGLAASVDGREDNVRVMIRPEDVLVLPAGDKGRGGVNEFGARLLGWRDHGGYVRLELEGPVQLVAHLTHAAFRELGSGRSRDFVVVLRPEYVHVLEA